MEVSHGPIWGVGMACWLLTSDCPAFLSWLPNFRLSLCTTAGNHGDLAPVARRVDLYSTTGQSKQEILAGVRRHLESHPDDLFLHRAYQDTFRVLFYSKQEQESLVTEYRERLGTHPESLLYQYLYARSLIGVRTPDAVSELEKVLERSPDFPWAHLELAEIYLTRSLYDQQKAQAHLQSFMTLCPSSLMGYESVRRIENGDFLQACTSKLQTLIGERTDWEVFPYYPILWALEFRVSPTSEHDQIRKRVAQDLQRLRSLDQAGDWEWLQTLREGYRLLGDKAAEQWVVEQQNARWKAAPASPSRALSEWQASHPYPKLGDPPEKVQAYWEAFLKVTDGWCKEWPDELSPWLSRLMALSHLQDVPPEAVKATGEGLLKSSRTLSGTGSPDSFTSAQVAELYAQHGVDLALIPQMVQQAFEQSEKELHASVGKTPEPKAAPERRLNQTRCVGLVALAEAGLKGGQPEKSREALFQLGEELAKNQPPEQDTEFMSNVLQAKYWERRARLAELEKRPLDALAFYQSALQYMSDPIVVFLDGDPFNRVMGKAKALWHEIGGSNEGWQVWLSGSQASKVQAESRMRANWTNWVKPMPEFAITDLEGRIWRLNDLKGKVSFINVWSTWCGPCRKELPLVQKLNDRLKWRQDIVVLTLNVDDNPGFPDPFLKEQKYTFPILPSPELLAKITPGSAIPLSWIIDRNGVIQKEYDGYEEDEDLWLETTLKLIEEASAIR